MKTYVSSPRRRLAVLLLAGCAGCFAPPSPPDWKASLVERTGDDAGIEFLVQGEPVDHDTAAPASLTGTEAVRLALRHDPRVQIAIARARAALADAKQSRLLPNPVLSVVVRFPERGGGTNVEAGLSAEFLSVLQMPRRVDAADRRLRAAGADVVSAALDAIADAERRVIEIQSAEAEAQALAERLGLLQRLIGVVRLRLEAGEATRLDLLSLEVERVELEADQMGASGRVRERRLALAALLGQPSSEANWTITAAPAVILAEKDERDWIAAALRCRPDLAAARWELAALGDDAATRRWWLAGGDAGLEAERDGGWAIGPGVSAPVPLFDWGQARRERADAQVIEAGHRLTQLGRAAVEEVRLAFAEREAAAASFRKLNDELVPLARRRHGQAEAQYVAGEADLVAFLQSQRQLLAAEAKQADARARIALADVRLRRAAGGRPVTAADAANRPTTQSEAMP